MGKGNVYITEKTTHVQNNSAGKRSWKKKKEDHYSQRILENTEVEIDPCKNHADPWTHQNQCSWLATRDGRLDHIWLQWCKSSAARKSEQWKEMQLLVQGKPAEPLQKSNKTSAASSGLDCIFEKGSVEESPLANHANLLILATYTLKNKH